ncbi:MAG: Unknown protein [uncultured Aureispira sp.]|uniref:Fibronectin type-III domain-containing protein n=1 Tax=uncultured Aureispira sp. TaxID=1331704 RepID=A0A6S6U742_9BACT|nr:MAG: Unknown protein [uncultured Aureispira sp.]
MTTFSIGQEEQHVPNQFLVQLKTKVSIQQLMARLKDYNRSVEWSTPQQLIPNMNIWLLEHNQVAAQKELLPFLQNLSTVQVAQYNHKVQLRSPSPMATTPNDPLFNNQWQYINTGANGGTAGVDLDAELAWDVTTGGVTATNDTIVVAILDDGLSPSQTDFGNNIWINRAEIPNNNIDDDGNGYRDDYEGWNSLTSTDLTSGGAHGTSVAGIVGAKGDNGNGISGVNWNVKMMIIKNNFNTTEANVLIAYGYALTQRKIYNQTNGQQGAYVVATNASWGLNNGQPANAPLWCSFYDTLGSYGILNVAATANANVDVDIAGDLPTTCPSDYLVAVTNINKIGQKDFGAAYGNTSIDLGAFGSGVYTTKAPSGFGTFGGTSAACPHVTGAIALLYSGACSNFMAYSLVYPDSAALKMKAYLLNGVVPISDLSGRSVSGGYLNLNNSLNICVNDCPSNTCFPIYQVYSSPVIDTQAQINFTFTPTINQAKYRYRVQGGMWSTFNLMAMGQDSFVLNSLLACTNYEVEVVSICGAIVGDSRLYSFKTDGCCEAPNNIPQPIVRSDSAYLEWPNVLAATSYLIEYKGLSATTWQQVPNVTSNTHWLSNLDSCTYYNIRIKTICRNGDTTNYSDTLYFVTLGCPSCSAVNYCAANGNNSADDWIDTFSVDNFTYASGNNSGYFMYSNVDILLGKGDYHNIAISQGRSFTEYVKIWLDINQDGDFLDPDEEIYNAIMPVNTTTIHGAIIVPPTALLGVTRMRVAMRWNNPPLVCGVTDLGEIEDYCVQIIPGTAIQQLPQSVQTCLVYPNPFSEVLTLDLDLNRETDIDLAILSATGQLVYAKTLTNQTVGKQQIELSPSIPTGVYFLQIKTEDGQFTKRILKL